MNICAITERKILLNVTNMDDRGVIKINVTTPGGGGNVLRDAKGVKTTDTTPTAAKPMVLTSSIVTTSDVDETKLENTIGDNAGNKDCLRRANGRSGKSGSGSGDANAGLGDDSGDPAAKKRKTRRGKPKHRKPKPYPKRQMSYEQRLRCRGIRRLTKTGGQPPAPYNTTQFLMEDHSDLPDLEQKLADVITSDAPPSFQKPLAPPRTRDSSFSVDSEEDYFYSSPEDEEEFLTKEFANAYEDLHAERLNNMTKLQLIQDYVQLEAKLDIMSKKLRGKSSQSDGRDGDWKNGGSSSSQTTTTSDNDVAKKLKICQQRIDELTKQNEQLRRENEALRSKSCDSQGSSVDSESDSDSDSTGHDNRSSCSCSSQSPTEANTPKSLKTRMDNDNRRNKRQSSVESDCSASDCTTSSKGSFEIDENSKSMVSDIVNGISNNHEIDGLPT